MTAPVLDTGRRPLGRRPLGPLGPTPLGPPGPLGPNPLGPLAGDGPVAPRPARRREIAPNATLVDRIDLTPSVARFVVRPGGGVPPFSPGQYFALGLEIEGALLQRPYSTASPAGTTDELEFLIRRVGTGTFTPHLWKIPITGRVWLGLPKGLFTLRPGDERTHLFVSTGTGLAPFISMTESLLRADAGSPNGPDTRPRIAVVHGVSYVVELAYRDRLEALAARGRLSYIPTISRPADPSNDGWSGASGRTEAIIGRVCDELGLDPAATVAYICGNPEMIEATAQILRERGFREGAIVRENYWTAPGGR
jgi:ferredoxin--NADP+ reductase